MYSSIFGIHIIMTLIPSFCIALRAKAGWYFLAFFGLAAVAINEYAMWDYGSVEQINFYLGGIYTIIAGLGIYFWSRVKKLPIPPPINRPIPIPPHLKKAAFYDINLVGWYLSAILLIVGIVGTYQYSPQQMGSIELNIAFWLITITTSVLGFIFLALRHANGWLLQGCALLLALLEILINSPANQWNDYLYMIVMVLAFYGTPTLIGYFMWKRRFNKQMLLFSRYISTKK